LRKVDLEEQLNELSTEKVSNDIVQDAGDQALTSFMESLRSSLQDAEYKEYVHIMHALKAVDDGTYGICIDCGGAISEKRLKHNANALRCITCQEAHETSERL